MLSKILFSYLSLGITSSIFVWMWFYIPAKPEFVSPNLPLVNKTSEFIQSPASDIPILIQPKAVNISAIKSPTLVASKLKDQQTANITSLNSAPINPYNSDEFIDPDVDDLITSQEYIEQDTGEFIDPDV